MTAEDGPKSPSPAAPRDGTPRVHGTVQRRNATLGRFTELKERVQFCDSTLGDYSYVERHSEVIYTDIGKFCAIAADVRINALRHPMERISQHKMTYPPNEYFTAKKLDKVFRESRKAARVDIGHDVWIGHGAIILPGVTIGHGAVIAAGAVVTKDVAPHAVMAGVPAVFVKWRFEPKISARIISLGWWDWEHDRLAETVDDMRDLSVEAFLKKYETASG